MQRLREKVAEGTGDLVVGALNENYSSDSKIGRLGCFKISAERMGTSKQRATRIASCAGEEVDSVEVEEEDGSSGVGLEAERNSSYSKLRS